MTIYAGQPFEGPFENTKHIDDVSGVYVIRGYDPKTQKYDQPLYVGESGEVKSRIEGEHHQKDCWNKHPDCLSFEVHYMPGATQEDRKRVEKQVIAELDPSCNREEY